MRLLAKSSRKCGRWTWPSGRLWHLRPIDARQAPPLSSDLTLHRSGQRLNARRRHKE
jgi:hypothetical protein